MELLPKKEELEPILNDRTTFYECGFNTSFDKLPFKKQLEIINNLVRQSIIPDCRPANNDVDTLIGNCHTAAKVSKKYLESLNICDDIKYVFARKRDFDPDDVTTTHAILLIYKDDKIYQYDATPYVGYKDGCVEEIDNRWYEDYIEINEDISACLDILKEIIYLDYNNKIDYNKLNYYKDALVSMEKYEILNGYVTHAYNSLLKYLDNEYVLNKINKLNPYDKRNTKNMEYKNSLIINKTNEWKDELFYTKDDKKRLELAQNIIQELKFVYPELERYAIINNKKYRYSTITPRVLMENELNVVMIKPSAHFLAVDDIIREKMDLGNPGLCEYITNLGETNYLGIDPMVYSHTLGLTCKREYTGECNIMFSKKTAKELKELKTKIRKIGKGLYNQEIIWTDNEKIKWDLFTTNLVHTTDSYSEAALHYLMGFPEHQLMTRFMYPNFKLDKVKVKK